MTVLFDAADPRRELFLTAQFGAELEAAHNSALYQFLVDTARQQANEAMAELVDCDAADLNEVRRLQNEVKRLNDMESWLDTAIQNGRMAYSELRHQDFE
jgi:hypothetical protein